MDERGRESSPNASPKFGKKGSLRVLRTDSAKTERACWIGLCGDATMKVWGSIYSRESVREVTEICVVMECGVKASYGERKWSYSTETECGFNGVFNGFNYARWEEEMDAFKAWGGNGGQREVEGVDGRVPCGSERREKDGSGQSW